MVNPHQFFVEVVDEFEVIVPADGGLDGAVIAHQVGGGAVGGDRDAVFVMRGGAAVDGHDGPAVLAAHYVAFAERDHGFDGDDEAGLEHRSAAALTEIGHVGSFVEAASQTVAYQFAHRAVPALPLGVVLHGVADVAHPVTLAGGVDAEVQAVLGAAAQVHGRFRHVAHAEGVGGVAVELIHDGAAVDAQDVPVLEYLLPGGQAVHDFFVAGDQ